MLERPPTASFVPTSDASGTGYGGVFLGKDDTVYFFRGEWTRQTRSLFASGVLDINILELVTVQFLLHLAGPHISGQCLTIMCDNQSSVDLLTSYRARKWWSAIVLEEIDLLLALHDVDAKFEWISTSLNRLADWLSRSRIRAFTQEVRARHGQHVRVVELPVPPAMLEISRVVRAACWSKGSLRLRDGKSSRL
jgi:hypothetical protein